MRLNSSATTLPLETTGSSPGQDICLLWVDFQERFDPVADLDHFQACHFVPDDAQLPGRVDDGDRQVKDDDIARGIVDLDQ
jgi:hypothetical protein